MDGCRFLPDDVVVSRVIMEVWPSDMDEMVGSSVSVVCEPDSTTSAPMFKLRQEYRDSSFDPTCTIEIQIEGIEKHSEKLKV